ncbi:hypothetical protein [Sorangium sp. So ce385]|uniref:hypothetical protein n=1 Tax=Sorangium sp. So ce385 TaxID=3133308 RepID=UPI003F5C0DBA
MRRHSLVRSLGLSTVVLSAASCTPPSPADTPVDVAVEARAADAPGEAPAGYEPVPRPEGILATVRMGSPAADLAALREYVTPDDDFGKIILADPSRVIDVFLGSLGAHVDLSAPIDAVIFDEEPNSASNIVMSLTLQEFQDSWQNAGFDFEPEADGRLAVRPKPGAGREAGVIAKAGLSCGIFRGGAPVKSHLVCAASRRKLDLAGPYLARTVTLQPVQPGLCMQFPDTKLREGLAKSERENAAGRGGTLAEMEGRRLGELVISEWAADLHDMAMDIQLGPAGVTAGFELRFRSLRSPLSLAMLGSAQSDVAPAFWRVPPDADLAFYFPGARPETMQAMAAPMWDRLGALELEDGAMREAWREAVAKLSKAALTGGPLIVAHGPTPDGASTWSSAQDPAQRYRGARAAAGGWFLISSFEPLSTWTSNVRALLTEPTMLPTRNPALAAGSGAGRRSSPKRAGVDVREVPVVPADGLPAGALHVVIRVVPDPAYAHRPLSPALEGAYQHHVFIAGTAESTWFAVSEIEGLARAKLKETLSGKSGGLSSRPELSRLRSLPAGGIGFVTLKGVLALQADKETTADLKLLDRSIQALGALSFDGKVPIFLSIAPSGPGEDSAATLRVSANAPKAGVKDLIEWLQ